MTRCHHLPCPTFNCMRPKTHFLQQCLLISFLNHRIGNSFDNYSTPSPPPSPSPYSYYTDYSNNYSSGSYFPGYYLGGAYPPPPPPRPFFERTGSYAAVGPSGPSVPLEYSSSFDSSVKGGKIGLGAGLAVGAAAGALGGLALEERMRYEERRLADMVESDVASARDDYGDMHYRDY